jgi:hypothetical protein
MRGNSNKGIFWGGWNVVKKVIGNLQKESRFKGIQGWSHNVRSILERVFVGKDYSVMIDSL